MSKYIVKYIPILRWGKTYGVDDAIGDLIAGVTVALTLIPQSMGYAALAGFDPQYGLYASFVGGYVYAIFGTVPQINIGPSALLSLLTFAHTSGTNIDFAILLCLTTGIVQLLTWIVQLGFVVDYVSVPVTSGFTSAAAIIVATAQIKGLLGLKFSALTFLDNWKNIFKHIGDVRISDTMLSIGCVTTLMIMQNLKKIPFKKPVTEEEIRKTARRKKILWFIAVARNAVVVVAASVTAFFMYKSLNDPFYITGNITPGLPIPKPPPFESHVDGKVYKLMDMLSHIGSGLIVVPMIGVLVNVAIAKAFSKGKKVDANQEILATAICGIVSSFFISFPVNGSISRSAVSDASGVRTPGAGFYTSTLVALTLLLLTPYFFYIPRAALSSIISCAVLHMVETDIIMKLWRVSRLDLIPLTGCFVCCLFVGIELGLICGIAIDILLLVYYNSRMHLTIRQVTDPGIPPHYSIRPVGRLGFACAEKVRAQLVAMRHDKDTSSTQEGEASTVKAPQILVLHCDQLFRLDFTLLEILRMLEADWRPSFKMVFCNTSSLVNEQLKGALKSSTFCSREELGNHLRAIEEPDSSKDSTV